MTPEEDRKPGDFLSPAAERALEWAVVVGIGGVILCGAALMVVGLVVAIRAI